MGRFMSPDWSAKEEPVPYAKLDDPQTLNLYAYVRNHPTEIVDPDGHQDATTAAQQSSGSTPAATPSCGPQTVAPGQTATAGNAPKADQLMEIPEVQKASYELFKQAGFGFDHDEHAMWVTYNNGKLDFVHWGNSHINGKEIWTGPLPPGTIAQIHSHPDKDSVGNIMMPKPSPKDHDLADGIQTNGRSMPVFTLSKQGIFRADPHKKEPAQVRDNHWYNDWKPQARKKDN